MIVTAANGPEFIASAIASSPTFINAGLALFDPEHPEAVTGIVVDNGLPNGLQGVESALSEPGKGLCIIVGQFEDGVVNDQVDGSASHACRFTVVVRENVERNRSTAGTGIKCVDAIVEVIRSVLTSPTTSLVFRRMASGTFRNLRVENGTWTCAATFTIPTVIQ